MAETLRLSMSHEDGQEWSAELRMESIVLSDDLTWHWLKGAFIAVGFDKKIVDAFFDEPGTDGSTP